MSGEEKPISEREIVQIDLSGQVVKKSEETKNFDIYSVPGYTMKVDESKYTELEQKIDDLRTTTDKTGKKKYNEKDIDYWQEAWVMNKTKAVPFQKHIKKDLERFTDVMNAVIFEDENLPKDIKKVCESVEYVEWDTAKYTLRVKKKTFEAKKAKWINWASGKNPKKKEKAQEEMLEFVAKKMKMKKSVFSTEGEFEAYKKHLLKNIFGDTPELLPLQTKLEVMA